MIILSVDPGGKNFGYCIQKIISTSPLKYEILESGMLSNTLINLKDNWTVEICAFEKEILNLIKKYKPTHFCAERYILRRVVTGGTTTEAISMMLGIIGLLLKKINCKLVTAAIWKNAFARASYKEFLKEIYREEKHNITPHQIDASLIGLYLAFEKKHYDGLEIEKHLKSLNRVNKCPIIKKARKNKKAKKK
jgi:Holliday junction resolvasome RuvABC endonuclease subunit